MSIDIQCCSFAEWFHRHALDDKNGGYYMHFNSGMGVNKLYNILEIYNYFKNEKIKTHRINRKHY